MVAMDPPARSAQFRRNRPANRRRGATDPVRAIMRSMPFQYVQFSQVLPRAAGYGSAVARKDEISQ